MLSIYRLKYCGNTNTLTLRAHAETDKEIETSPHGEGEEDVQRLHIGIVEHTPDEGTDDEGTNSIQRSDLCHLCLTRDAEEGEDADHADDELECDIYILLHSVERIEG